MSSNVQITAGSGTTIGTEETTINSVAVQVQQVKPVLGARTSYVGSQSGRLVDGTASEAAAYTDPRLKVVRIQVTPTISTSPAYTAKDAIGALMTFANAVRASGGSCMIGAVQVVDKGNSPQDASIDLVLFDRSITAPTDNAVFAPTDAEAANCVGVIPIGAYSDFSVNSVAAINNVGLEVLLNGTDLFAVAVARGTPTYSSTTDLVFTITPIQD